MSTLTQTQPLEPTVPAASRPEPASVATPDPLVLGLPLIAVGAIALGLQLVGYVNSASNGSPLALLTGGSGLGLIIATIWATRLDRIPASSPWARGRSLPTTVLGTLATFFISYSLLVLGLTHGWYGIRPADVTHTIALFQISWGVGFVFLTIASVRLPAVFTVLFASFTAVIALLLIATLGPSTTAGHIAGVLSLLIGLAAGYVFLATASAASGGREYPLGSPVAK